MLYGLFTGKHVNTLKRRLGFFEGPEAPHKSGQRLWFHAASVGEVQVAKALIPEVVKLFPDAFIILTAVTDQGLAIARSQLANRVHCLYAPLDLPWVVKRFIQRLNPTAYICLETELWPNMITMAAQHDIALLLLNGRLSEKSSRNYLRVKKFFSEVINKFHAIAVIQADDKNRFVALGSNPAKIMVTGNAKYDLSLQETDPADTSSLEEIGSNRADNKGFQHPLGLEGDQPLLIAGSTHSGEEEIILKAYARIKQEINDLVLILAPRHLGRIEQIKKVLHGQKLEFQLYSDLQQGGRTASIILLDQMGKLAGLYSMATYVFCGGSFVDKGGHNIMEPAFWGKPPMYGVYMNDFKDARNLLESVEAGFTVRDAQELAERVLAFHADPALYNKAAQRAREIVIAQQGAAARQAALILKTLEQHRGRQPHPPGTCP